MLHVVRAFEDEAVAHPSGRVDPLDDAETIELELILADQERSNAGCSGSPRPPRAATATRWPSRRRWTQLTSWLDQGNPARSARGRDAADALDLLTAKPTLYVANVDDSGNPEAVEPR